MTKYKFLNILLFLSIAIKPDFVTAQSKISAGISFIAAQIKGGVEDRSIEDIKPKDGYKHFNPAIGFSYEWHLNKRFFISGNANYSIAKAPYYSFSFTRDLDELQYRHQSINVLFNWNFQNLEPEIRTPFNLNLGFGGNLNLYNNFRVKSIFDFIQDLELGKEHDRYELGFIYQIATEIKNIKLAFNHAIGTKLYDNIDHTIKSSNWYSISAYYVFILND